ncbi:hypothetical protein Tco_1524289 [Tanacetum coccineum]
MKSPTLFPSLRPLFILAWEASRIKFIGNVSFDELFKDQYVNEKDEESPFDTEFEIKFIRKEEVVQEMHDAADTTLIGDSQADQEIEEADFDLESMPNYEIIFVLGNDDDNDYKEPSMANDIALDNLVDKLVSITNTGDADTNISAANAPKSYHLGHLKKQIDSLSAQLIKYIKQILHSTVKVPRDIMVVNAQHLQTKVEKNASDLHELVELVCQLVCIIDSVAPPVNAATEERKSFRHNLIQLSSLSNLSPTPPLSMIDKGKGIAYTSNVDIMKQVIPYIEEGGSAPKLPNLHLFSTVGEGPMTLKAKASDASSQEAKFHWVATQAGKLGIPPPPQLTAFKLLITSKKRKKKAEIIQEMFVKEKVVVDGMHKNIVPPLGVIGLDRFVHMSCKRILAITNVVDRPEFLISIIGNPSVHPPARIPLVLDIGDDKITMFTREYTLLSLNFVHSHVLTTANCSYYADTCVNGKCSMITRSSHINVEQQDIVAAVQQVLPQSIVALLNTRAIQLPHTMSTVSRKKNNKRCRFAHECTFVDHPSNNYCYYVDPGVDDNHFVITHSRHIKAGQEGVATPVQKRSRKPAVALSYTQDI